MSNSQNNKKSQFEETIDEQIQRIYGVTPKDGDIVHVDDKGQLTFYRAQPKADEVVTVPVVAYVNGKKHVIGEADIRGSQVSMTLNDRISETIMNDLMSERLPHLSIGHYHDNSPEQTTLF